MGRSDIVELGKNTRFPVNRKDHTKKHPEGYLTAKLKKWLKKAMYPARNPDTGEIEKVKGFDAVAISIIKAALKGDMRAAEILLDRLEGKPVQKVENVISVNKMGDITLNNKELEFEVGPDTVDSSQDS